MASRPPGGGQQAAPSHHGGPLLDLEDSNPIYNDGRSPSVNDEELFHQYDIDSSERSQPRPSVSNDAFVGAQQSTRGLPGGPGALHTGHVQAPHLSAENGRTYSQTSDLDNYQRYSDMDDLPDDDPSMQGGYYHTNGPVEGGSSRMVSGRGHRSRNSVLSMGGGLMGKAKNMFGMGPEYSEMDMPLRETASGQPRMNSDMTEEHVKKPEHKRFDVGNFKFGLGRGKPDPSTLGPRIIHLNIPPANSQNRYLDNHVSTAKYNVATFLPKFLFEQFSKYANLFFLFTAALQQIPNISPTNRYTTIGPLIIVLLVSAGKELIEDFKRKNSDKSLNHSKARALRGSSFENLRWVSVKVGDIVRVESEEPFPADLVLLASSEPEGLCYIETANLDGETNLKIKQAIPETANLVSPNELSRLSGRVRSEQPNSSLYTYEATLTMTAGGGEKELPLAPDQLLLRGATLRNTPWIHGIVVSTGHETKLMRNATATPIKRTHVERMVNIQILMLVAVLVGLSIVSSVGDLIVRATAHSKLSYLYIEDTAVAKQFFSDIFTYWVLYSNLVPISLFVTTEVVKYYQAFLINSDLDMYYDRTDTAAICRTSSLVEELGQIEYIFSDKTGTLTCNMMEFKQCSIGGIQYADEAPEDRRATEQNLIGIYDFKKLRENLRGHQSQEEIHHFLALLSTCHTVIPERRDEKPGEIKYQAASPDEGALVEGAVILGYQFTARRPRSVMITVEGEDYEYELLAVLEFNSTRKRMSTILRCPDGKVRCYCKGADTVILERLGKDNANVEATLQHLEEYATEGLRTLCLAMREIPESELQQWLHIFDKANTTVSGNRPEELDKAAEIVEHDFFLLGATAIEDKLQDGVPDTIHTLQEAGIKIWVLTGDRQETAINIGMSCKLISEDMTLLIVNEENSEGTRTNLVNKLTAIRNQSAGGAELETLALVIDGKSLTFALEKDMERMFLELAMMCKAVICWFVFPGAETKQHLTKFSQPSVTLAESSRRQIGEEKS